MAIALIGSAGKFGYGGQYTTYTSTAGNTLIAITYDDGNNGGNSTSALTDTFGNTWSVIRTTGTPGFAIFYCVNANAVTRIRFNSSHNGFVLLYEFSGVGSFSSGSGVSESNFTKTLALPTLANDSGDTALIIAAILGLDSGVAWSPPFTALPLPVSYPDNDIRDFYTLSNATSVSPVATTSNSHEGGGIDAIFLPSSSGPPVPTAKFTHVESGLTSTFDGSGSTSGVTFEWDFGDESSVSTDESPSHLYSSSGTYTVTLTVTDLGGSNTATSSITIVAPVTRNVTLYDGTSEIEVLATMWDGTSEQSIDSVFVYIPTNVPDTTWGASIAAAQAGTGLAKVLYLGDSILEGTGATTVENRLTAKVVAGAKTKYGLSGGSLGMRRVFTATAPMPDSASWRIPTSANSGGVGNNWFSTQGWLGADLNSIGNYLEWTVIGDAVDVVHLQGTNDGGQLTVSVDGVDVTTIDTASGTNKTSVSNRVSLGENVSHTVRVTLTGGLAAVDGIVVYGGDTVFGVQWWDCTHGSYSSISYANNGNVEYQRGWTDFAPSLIVDNATGVGEYNNGGTVLSAFEANLQQRIGAYAAIPGNPTVIFMLTYTRSDQHTTQDSKGNVIDDYFNSVKSAASAAGCMVLDLDEVYPGFILNDSWTASDNGHPNDVGHQKIADAILALI